MRRMNLGLGVAVALLGVMGTAGLLASNVGFKINYQLTAPGPGAGTGKNAVALPYLRQAGLDNCRHLMEDIGGGSLGPVVYAARFNEATDTFQVYTGRMGSPFPFAFALSAGEGYFVAMQTTINYIVVGSHDPAAVISIDAPGPGSATGKNFFAPPYHTTAANALDLMKDIDGSGGGIASVVSASRYNKASDAFAVYTGRMGSPTLTPFPLSEGEAYFVSMTTTRSHIPSHY